jgi:hypothetical protein
MVSKGAKRFWRQIIVIERRNGQVQRITAGKLIANAHLKAIGDEAFKKIGADIAAATDQ